MARGHETKHMSWGGEGMCGLCTTLPFRLKVRSSVSVCLRSEGVCDMASKSEPLEKRKRELGDAQAEINKALKRAKQQEKTEQRAWQLSSFLLHTALIVYSLSGYTAQPAATFLLNSGRKRHWPDKEDGELLEMVERLFMECDLEELALLSDIEDPMDIAALKAALPYVEQWQLVQWTARANLRQGVAPSTESVLQRYEERRMQLPAAVRPCAVGVASRGSARVWAGAWRQRWGGRHGRIRICEQVPVEELRTKVRGETEYVGHRKHTQMFIFAVPFRARNPFPFWERIPFPKRERCSVSA